MSLRIIIPESVEVLNVVDFRYVVLSEFTPVAAVNSRSA